MVGEKTPERAIFSLAADKQEALLVATAQELKLELSPVLLNPTKKAGRCRAHVKQVKKVLAEWVEKWATAPAPREAGRP